MYGFVIPTLGKHLLTSLLAGETLNITRVMVGSGQLPAGAEPSALTDLVQPVAAATISIPQVTGNTCTFVVEYRNDLNGGLETGFWLSEFGVFAQAGAGEILLYYGMLGDYPQPVSAYTNGAIDIRRFPVTIILTDDVDVDISIPSVAVMTADDVADYFQNVALPKALAEMQSLVASASQSVIVSDTVPDGQPVGGLWLDTSDGPADTGGGIVILNAVVSDTEPPDTAELWFNT